MTAIVLILMRFFDKIFIELKSIHPCCFEFREYRDREKRRISASYIWYVWDGYMTLHNTHAIQNVKDIGKHITLDSQKKLQLICFVWKEWRFFFFIWSLGASHASMTSFLIQSECGRVRCPPSRNGTSIFNVFRCLSCRCSPGHLIGSRENWRGFPQCRQSDKAYGRQAGTNVTEHRAMVCVNLPPT